MSETAARNEAPMRSGWFATPKGAREMIRRDFDGRETCATALAVFDALCEIANDKGASTFTVDQPWIAVKAGCSVRTVGPRLRELVSAGVITMQLPTLRGPATFTIPALASVPPFGDYCRTSRNNRRAFGKHALQASLPTTEELLNNGGKTSEHLRGRRAGMDGQQVRKDQQPALQGMASELKAKSVRPRDPLFDTLAEVCGANPSEVAGTAAKGCGKALADIVAATPDVTPEEFRRRAGNYRLHFPDASLTWHALAKHWAKCGQPPEGKAIPSPDPEAVNARRA